MGALVPFVVFVAVLTVVLAGLSWLATRTRRRGVGRDVMGPVDLIYRPHTHQIHREIRAQEERRVGLPAADDPGPRA